MAGVRAGLAAWCMLGYMPSHAAGSGAVCGPGSHPVMASSPAGRHMGTVIEQREQIPRRLETTSRWGFQG